MDLNFDELSRASAHPLNISTLIGRLGFDLATLLFSLRTAVAACAALLIAWLLGFEHPQWSAMTVWVVSQPTRGQLLEKSLFRVVGTIGGVLFGIVLMFISDGKPIVLVAGLAIWVALCAGIGNLQRSFLAYGTILAGYSASMVALIDSAHPDRVFILGFDRAATILVGVLLALAVGLIFTPKAGEGEMVGRVRRLMANLVRNLSMRLGRKGDVGFAVDEHVILVEMATIEDSLELHGAGSLQSRRSVHAVRSLLMAAISLLLRAREGIVTPKRSEIIAASEEAAAALANNLSQEETLAALEGLVRATGVDTRLHDSVLAMVTAFRVCSASGAETAHELRLSRHSVVLHRDWPGAWRAFVRAGITMLAVGAAWIMTGWSAGALLLLGVSIMTSIFSTFDNPARMMSFVFVGQVCGALGAVACRFLAWPLASNEVEILFLTMPFILAAALFFSHQLTLPFAFDYAMVSLLLLHPTYPPTGTFPEMLKGGLAVVSAPLIAMAAYRLIFRLDAGRRLRMSAVAMIREVVDLARATDPTARRLTWKARLYHRLLRLVSLAGRSGHDQRAAIDGGLAVLAIGSAILTMRDMLSYGDLPKGTERSLYVALARLQRVERAPEKAAAALSIASKRLSRLGMTGVETLICAAAALAASAAFFLRDSR